MENNETEKFENSSYFSTELSLYVDVTPEKKKIIFSLVSSLSSKVKFLFLFNFQGANAQVFQEKIEKQLTIVESPSSFQIFPKRFVYYFFDFSKNENFQKFNSVVAPFLFENTKERAIKKEIPEKIFSDDFFEKIYSETIFSTEIEIFPFKNFILKYPKIREVEDPQNRIIAIIAANKNWSDYFYELKQKFSYLTKLQFYYLLCLYGLSAFFIFFLLKLLIDKKFQNKVVEDYIFKSFDKLDLIIIKILEYFYPDFNKFEREYIEFVKFLFKNLKRIMTDMNRMYDIIEKTPIYSPENLEASKQLGRHFADMQNYINYLRYFSNLNNLKAT
jgi:hypothetical protein